MSGAEILIFRGFEDLKSSLRFDSQSFAVGFGFDERQKIVVGFDLDTEIFLRRYFDDKCSADINCFEFRNFSFFGIDISRTFFSEIH